MQKMLAKSESRGAFLFNPQIPEILVRKQMEQTILVRFGQNIWQHLSRWSTLDCPTGMTEMTLSIWHNCCPCSYSSVSCLQAPTQAHTGLGQVCTIGMYCTIGCVEFPKFQTRIFVERNVP